MLDVGFQPNIILVYFFYGLAFFSMGLAITFEFGRAPLLAEARVLRPLAVFGLLHGIHEWLEIFIILPQWFEVTLPVYWDWTRLWLLAISFASLVAYGIQVLRPPNRLAAMDAWIGAGLLTLYAALIVLTGATVWGNFPVWIGRADVLARYVLAVPGAFLAAAALFLQAYQAHSSQRVILSNNLRWAAIGFSLYAITQIFVPAFDFFPANFINAGSFAAVTGIPIQLVRAVLAFIITSSLIRATQTVESERQRQLEAAKEERLEALERVQEELVKREDLRRKLLRHTVMAQEEERSRIARELHDELAQILTGFTLELATLKSLSSDNIGCQDVVERLQDLCQQMSNGIYTLVHDLRPAQLDDLGLVPAVQHLIDDAQRHMKLAVQLEVLGGKQRLDHVVETVLFRVIQEALTNVARHAHANAVAISLHYQPAQTVLVVSDDGVGFRPKILANPQTGFGIAGMRERVRSVGGGFQLDSAPGQGTRIQVEIPLEADIVNEENAYESDSSFAG